MNGVKRTTHVAEYLRYFSEVNEKRPTRLGVLEEKKGAIIDYWLEDGMPLVGVDVDCHKPDKMSVIIMLSGKDGLENGHFSHVVRDVQMVKLNISADGLADGLDVLDSDGKTTVLSFENF